LESPLPIDETTNRFTDVGVSGKVGYFPSLSVTALCNCHSTL